MTRAGALLLLCTALLLIVGRSEWLGPGLPKLSDTFPGQHWACQEREGNSVFWWVSFREFPLIFLFQSVMTSARPWGTTSTCSYREAMTPISNKLKSITKPLMYWKLLIPWRAVLIRVWQPRIRRMLSVLWWVRLSVNVPVGSVWGWGCQGSAQGTGKWGHHILSTLALPQEPGCKKILMNEEVERMWLTPTVWERILQENSVQPWGSWAGPDCSALPGHGPGTLQALLTLWCHLHGSQAFRTGLPDSSLSSTWTWICCNPLALSPSLLQTSVVSLTAWNPSLSHLNPTFLLVPWTPKGHLCPTCPNRKLLPKAALLPSPGLGCPELRIRANPPKIDSSPSSPQREKSHGL